MYQLPEEEKGFQAIYDEFCKFYGKPRNGVHVVADGDSAGVRSVIVDNGTWNQHTIHVHPRGIGCNSLSHKSPLEAAQAALARLKA